MAGRFVFQELASGMSRSTSRLGAQGSASSGATAPVITRASEDGVRTLSNVFHGAATHPGTALPSSSRGLHGRAGGGIGTLSSLFHRAVRPGKVVPSNREILSGCSCPCQEDGIRTLSNVFHGAAIHLGTALHGRAARCLNTFPCSSAAAGRSTNGMPSSIINHKKSAFVDSVGVKRNCSSHASKKTQINSHMKELLHEQNMKMIKLQSEFEITKAEMEVLTAEVLRANIKNEVIKGQTTVLKYCIIILGAIVVGRLLAEWDVS